MSSAELAELAFEQFQRRLDTQERVLEELRARTAILLAASSLAASFLGKEAFEGRARPLSSLEQQEIHRRLAYDLDAFGKTMTSKSRSSGEVCS